MIRYGTTTLTGEYIVDTSSLIHDFFSKECDECVHLVVDTTLATDKVRSVNLLSMTSISTIALVDDCSYSCSVSSCIVLLKVVVIAVVVVVVAVVVVVVVVVIVVS